ncbi:MAG: DUF2975 domain-containing protein [Bacillota bacterium]|nr:DUF2975 domain-containing protein [Bacillota bacterium]
MNAKKTIILLKILFVAVILVGIMQSVFSLFPQIPNRVQTYLFALRLPVEMSDPSQLKTLCTYILICALPIYILILYIIIKLIQLLHPLSEGFSPFSRMSVSAVKHIGIACWIYAAVSTIVEYAGAQILFGTLQNSLKGWNIEFSLPVIPIVIGAVILSLGEVFYQGLDLKQDNDSIV